MLGCGNSKLSEEMWDDGYKNIVNTDNKCDDDMNIDLRWSVGVIEYLDGLHSKLMFTGHEMDVRDLKFEDNSFDFAIDKGTMDAMMTTKGDVWVCAMPVIYYTAKFTHNQDPPEQVIRDCTKEVDETLRSVLKYTNQGQIKTDYFTLQSSS
ncbi:hypothetical protein H0H92_006261 [Tricholoma furcatifolium]|nr:hypothetical protein H0H92_006261 [Tricholoma furcatifolium]